MIRILYTYISRELAKVTGLALVAFTLVLTIFAIIEPLREQGLAGAEAVALFAYTLPVMLSLTLPVGALFAATIVYGRFSQDNELLACRSSGISTLSLLRPALVLALIVTAASLVLSNFVAPVMAARAGKAAKTNLRAIAYSQLRSRKYIEHGTDKGERFVIYADRVDVANDTLSGVVGVVMRPNKAPLMGTAASTKVTFLERDEESYVAVDALYVSAGTLGNAAEGKFRYDYTWEEHQPFPPIKMPNLIKEKPSWYPWAQLVGTISHPERDGRVSREMEKVRRDVAHDLFCREVAGAINGNAAAGYSQLSGGGRSYILHAGSAKVAEKGTVDLYSAPGVPVSVMLWDEDPEAVSRRTRGCVVFPAGPAMPLYAGDVLLLAALPSIVTADAGQVNTDYAFDRSVADVELMGGVSVAMPTRSSQRQKGWDMRIDLPQRVVDSVKHIKLANAYQEASRLSGRPAILDKIKDINEVLIPAQLGRLVGEMHSRIAYGVSCFLLVVMGAALGLLCRGGQILSAFATSAVPGLFVIILVFMGKQLAQNSKVPLVAGLSVIWAGVAALGVACLFTYVYLCRK